jgi:hypothetical protein
VEVGVGIEVVQQRERIDPRRLVPLLLFAELAAFGEWEEMLGLKR